MRTLKLALLGATFLIGAAASASAADVYEPAGSYKDAPAPYYPAITWTGFYVGGHLGGTFGDEITEKEDGEDDFSFDVDNALTWGAHVGYNWQTPSNWVFGIEGDLSGINDEVGEDNEDLTSYLASVRGRIGLARGATLFYATAGVAFLGYDEDASDDDIDVEDAVGYVVGAGLEHKFRNNFSLGLEGLYYDVSSDVEIDGESVGDVDRDFFTVRARLNYHFNSPYAEPLK